MAGGTYLNWLGNIGKMIDEGPCGEVDKWKLAIVVAAWFGTDEQVAYAQMRYEQECKKEEFSTRG